MLRAPPVRVPAPTARAPRAPRARALRPPAAAWSLPAALLARRLARLERGAKPWAQDLGIEAPKVELTMLKDGFGEELRGMRCTSALGEEAIITVPAQVALQVTTGGAAPDFVEDAVWQQLPWWGQLALLLLEARQNGALSAWLGSLPQSMEEIPMNWSNEELEKLEYPALIRQIERQRAEVSEAYGRVAHLGFSEAEFRWAVQQVRSRAFTGPYEGRGPQDRLLQLGFIAALLLLSVSLGLVSLENGINGALAAAISIPLTDFFVGQSSSLKRHVMCPVVDYLNHDSEVNSDIAYEYFANAFAVRVQGSFQVGEEVCINYGQRSNDALLQFYGFVERDNCNDSYTLDILQHLDLDGEELEVTLTRTGPDDASMARLLEALGGQGAEEEAMLWKAVSIACESELQHRSSGAAHEVEGGLAARFAAEKEKVLIACRAHAESRCRASSAAPLSLLSGAVVNATFQDCAAWHHSWASSVNLDGLSQGLVVLPNAFDASLAKACLEECVALDGKEETTVTTNRCNRGSRSAWLDLEQMPELQRRVPHLARLSAMLAGLPLELEKAGCDELQVQPATMIAVYPQEAASYKLHKDSYAPADNDPATGATRRWTVLAYLNDWRSGDGGELRIHEATKDRPNPKHFQGIEPKAGTVVIFDSRKTWHAVAPSLRGDRWAMTLWVH